MPSCVTCQKFGTHPVFVGHLTKKCVSIMFPARGFTQQGAAVTIEVCATDIDVERFWREGYLTASAVFSGDQLDRLRAEADRLLRLCSSEAERYARRIEWEVDHLATGDRA